MIKIETSVRAAYSHYVISPKSFYVDADHFMQDELKGKIRDFSGKAAKVVKITNAGFQGFQILGLRSDGTYIHAYVKP